jgi:hypothetical protein
VRALVLLLAYGLSWSALLLVAWKQACLDNIADVSLVSSSHSFQSPVFCLCRSAYFLSIRKALLELLRHTNAQ